MIESMRCRNCGAALGAGRIDRSLGIVVCEHCGGVHEIAREPVDTTGEPTGGSGRSRPKGAERGTVALPERFDVHRGSGTLQVRWAKGNKSGAVVLALFACVWGVATIGTGVFLLTPISLLLFYYAAVRGVNRTELRASATEVEIRRGPLPWKGARHHLKRGDVTQLYAREVVTRSTMDNRDGRRVQERRSYSVETLDPAGRKRALITGLSSPDQALWFERELEQVFGIENVAVAGEVR